MKIPRDVNGTEAVRALKRLGFEFQRQTGSHVIMRRGPRTVVVPQHKGLIEQAGLTRDEFTAQL